MGFTIILFVILIVLALVVVFAYNNLITMRIRSQEAWSDIDVQLKRRYDMIPNLVETVKGYASHEKTTLEEVIKARNIAMQAMDVKEKQEAENVLTGTLKSLFAVSENYPDLKAAANFLELQRELRDTEDKIQSSRRFYNANVRDLNIKIDAFPSNIIASIFKFKKMEMFELASTEESQAPNVNF